MLIINPNSEVASRLHPDRDDISFQDHMKKIQQMSKNDVLAAVVKAFDEGDIKMFNKDLIEIKLRMIFLLQRLGLTWANGCPIFRLEEMRQLITEAYATYKRAADNTRSIEAPKRI